METRTQSVARRTAQLDLIDGLIARLEEDIRDLDPEPLTLNFRLGAVNSNLLRISETMTGKQQALIEEEGRRRDALRSAMKLEQRQNATGELRERFRLLEEHYNSDLARLLAISELDSFFIQLLQSRCPLCGAEEDQHDPSIHHDQAAPTLTDIQRACVAESNKIRELLKDLVGTTNELDVELSSIELNLLEQRALFASSSKALEETLAPAAEQSTSEWNETILLKDRLTQAQVLNERLEALQAERNRIAATKWKQGAKAEESRLLDLESTDKFSLTVNRY